MSKTELLKLKAELARVESGIAEQEYQIAQKMDEVERLETSMKISKEKIIELKEKLKQYQ